VDILLYACTFASTNKYLDTNIFKSKNLSNPEQGI
jgi:hypothetical protein